jgi:hypothetical protein
MILMDENFINQTWYLCINKLILQKLILRTRMGFNSSCSASVPQLHKCARRLVVPGLVPAKGFFLGEGNPG